MNSSVRKPSRRQLAVIDDLFDGKMEEAEILEKHNLRISVFRKWLSSDNFIAELDQRAAAARRQSEMIIARFAPAAAAELVALTSCEKEDVRRRACLDIITAASGNPPGAGGESGRAAGDAERPDIPINLSPKLAGKILAVMAEGEKDE